MTLVVPLEGAADTTANEVLLTALTPPAHNVIVYDVPAEVSAVGREVGKQNLVGGRFGGAFQRYNKRHK